MQLSIYPTLASYIRRSTGVDIIPISVMISKRRLLTLVMYVEWTHRLPKIMLHSQLLGDTGSLSRGRGAPEMSYKSALLDDMRNFGIMNRKSKDNCCINTHKWEILLDIATDRFRWCMQSVKSVVYSRKH